MSPACHKTTMLFFLLHRRHFLHISGFSTNWELLSKMVSNEFTWYCFFFGLKIWVIKSFIQVETLNEDTVLTVSNYQWHSKFQNSSTVSVPYRNSKPGSKYLLIFIHEPVGDQVLKSIRYNERAPLLCNRSKSVNSLKYRY